MRVHGRAKIPTPEDAPPLSVAVAGARSATHPARLAARTAAASRRSSNRRCSWMRMACASSSTLPCSSCARQAPQHVAFTCVAARVSPSPR
eukprot:3346829-Pyramimonas_sp.AAC.1